MGVRGFSGICSLLVPYGKVLNQGIQAQWQYPYTVGHLTEFKDVMQSAWNLQTCDPPAFNLPNYPTCSELLVL